MDNLHALYILLLVTAGDSLPNSCLNAFIHLNALLALYFNAWLKSSATVFGVGVVAWACELRRGFVLTGL